MHGGLKRYGGILDSVAKGDRPMYRDREYRRVRKKKARAPPGDAVLRIPFVSRGFRQEVKQCCVGVDYHYNYKGSRGFPCRGCCADPHWTQRNAPTQIVYCVRPRGSKG